MFQMNIGASEWGIIILLMLVIMGSKGFSKFARLLGRAVGEYDKAREMIRNEKDYSPSGDSNFPSSVMPRVRGPVGTEREKLETIAKALGIEEGELTDDQLRSLISRKIQKI